MSNSYKNGAFALGLVIGGGIALNLFLWLDYRTQQKTYSPTNSQDDNEYSQIGHLWDGLIGTFVSPSDTLAQWIMAIFTISATIVLVFTLRAANRTNIAAVKASTAAIEANDIMRQDRRPWVLSKAPHHVFAEVLVRDGKALGPGCSFTIPWENFGKTPAIDLSIDTHFGIVHVNEATPAFPSVKAFENTVLGPDSQIRGFAVDISGGEYEAFVSGAYDVIVSQRVDYRDCTPPHRERFSEATVRFHCKGHLNPKDGQGPYQVQSRQDGQNAAI